MKNLTKKLFITMLIVSFFARIIYVESRYSYYPDFGSKSQEESINKGVFIRSLTPSIKELYYNRNYNLIIKEVWLEHDVIVKNRLLWLSEKKDIQRNMLNIIYEFKDRRTGEIKKDVDSMYGVSFTSVESDGISFSVIPGLNLAYDRFYNRPNIKLQSKFLSEEKIEAEKIEVEKIEVEKGIRILFK